MTFNIVVMILGLLVGYFEQSKLIFISAIVIFIYRNLEFEYFGLS